MSRKYTWKPDVPDHRDFYFSAAAPIPRKINPLGLGNPIEDQGNLGSCTGNSATSMVEIIIKSPPLSRLMAYYNGRMLENNIKEDSGCSIREVIKGISKFGVCSESLCPYVISKFKNKPTKIAYADGLKIIGKIGSYQRIIDLESLKIAIASGYPVTFGFSVPQYFCTEVMSTRAFLPLPSVDDKIIGGHAVVAVGFNDKVANPYIWVRNSWGSNWGMQGYFKMDQRWFTSPNRLVDDMWTIIPK